ncbi:ComEC/Rec2 family competence protein [Paenibacillus alvei]|uniref:ComEC/Rec2 family competence protein n=1 Tax=Paenibacillus alvei TaxID=44250 RepID=UPI00028A38DE|nr:ComEC/Rec2 family competence protein [Paenibacillus alvei]EJW17304.1 ComE operon protein 3 [Paenibacillus alvei DSM 29]MCY9542910.1 ComEC/Rec2 family competence protein [Paenibacillus alvei]MCY9706912.1 ComEC/Rec2 family competence protein [Paenibacillus alvei]MCY9753366.1 ComEC/Rec2 family competence protein [Paenibacillus alvei]MEC0081499.1 ComEC/Rec2 family competence protein [Paenibacillus alvei]
MLARRPLVAAACIIAAGFHLSAVLSNGEAWVAAFGLTLLLPICVIGSKCSRMQAIVYALLLMFAVLYYQWIVKAGDSVWSEWESLSLVDQEQELNGEWEGIIFSHPEIDGDRMQFQLAATGWRTPEESRMDRVREMLLVQVKLLSKQELKLVNDWKRGQLVRIQGKLDVPGDAGNFGGFSYRDYLRTLHIHSILKVSGLQHMQLHVSLGTISIYEPIVLWNRMLAYVDQGRERLANILQHIYVQPHSGYMQGLVLGTREDMDPDIYQQFSQLGLTHVLAISGLHVGVLIGALLSLLRLLRITKETSISITMGFIPIYVLMTGASASVIRAGMMALLALYGAKRGWLKDGLHLLAAAFLLMALWDPRYVLQVGFQLSFVVTAGLIVFVPQVMNMLGSLPRTISSAISVTLVAQSVSLPLTVYYFNQFSLLSFLANFVIVPCISLIVLPLGSISLLIGSVYEPLAKPIAWLVEHLNEFTFRLVHWLAQIEGATIIWPTPPLWWIVLYYVIFAIALESVRRWSATRQIYKRGKNAAVHHGDETQPLDFIELPIRGGRYQGIRAFGAVFIFGFVVVQGYTWSRPDDATVSFIDVGQGDSVLISTATGKHMLIDGGGTVNFRKPNDHWRERRVPFEVGEKVVVPLLKQRGIRELDVVLLTHADQDHAGGLQAVLKHIPVKQFIMNGTWKSSVFMNNLYGTAIDKGIPIRKWEAGQRWKLDQWSTLEVLYPYPSSNSDSSLQLENNQNEASLVVQVTLTHPTSGEHAVFMLTGDLEADGERQMLQYVAERSPRVIDVLKVAHHGSKTSTTPEWIEQWHPKIGIISAGRNNRYGHPHPKVLDTLRDARIPAKRTDIEGEIQFKLTSGGLKVRAKRDRIHL